MIRYAALLFCLLMTPLDAVAHKASDSYLTIAGNGDSMTMRWDIALRDLDHAIGLDSDGDGAITWGELRARHGTIEAYSLSRLQVSSDGSACVKGTVEHRVDRHSDGAYAVMSLPITCPTTPTYLTVDYNLLFDLDPQHRGLISIEGGDKAVLGPDQQLTTLAFKASHANGFRTFFLEGIHHLVGGVDHVLFLLVVLLPIAVGRTAARRERPFDAAFLETAKILTAFTLAHGLTLSAAVLDYVALPSKPVEVLIALSIAIAAVDNVYPFLGSRRWLIAGSLGLIHGFGFASVLGPLDLPATSLAVALLGFNLGIEIAQLVIALIVLSLGFMLSRQYLRIAMTMRTGGSVVAFALASLWTMDRAFDLAQMPF